VTVRDSQTTRPGLRDSSWLEYLRCPVSGSPLSLESDGSLVAVEGGRRYASVADVPVLLAEESSVFDADALLVEDGQEHSRSIGQRAAGLARWLLHHPPSASRNVGSRENYAELAALLRERAAAGARRARILVVGGGTLGVGAEELLTDPAFDTVETDVYLGPRTRVVCDAHRLPFADGSFDAVVCQAVLEHVLEPWRVAAEIWRVLAPDGYVYSEVPFMQQVHAGALDFTRFTHLGHRRLWRCFDELRSGAQGGPGMALIWSLSYFLRAMLPRRLWGLADRATSLGFFWLKYFDDYLVSRPGGLDAASGTFFLGRRRLNAIDDRTLLRGYRGGGPQLGS
jgi:SAM-dependent methyltransferase